MSKDCTCPQCGRLFSLEQYGPIRADDIIICGECISVLVFDRNLQPRIAGPADYQAMSDDVRTLTTRVTQQALHQREVEIRVERHARN